MVEQIIGKLVTDEGFRSRFVADPAAALEELARCGCDLNACERRALLRVEAKHIERFAETIDPSLVRVDLSGGVS
jgi:Ribosomally synthesized peptide prototyped by Frankia Franean1_4349.